MANDDYCELNDETGDVVVHEIAEFKVSDLLTVKMRVGYFDPVMLVNGVVFHQCTYPVLETPTHVSSSTIPLEDRKIPATISGIDAILFEGHGTLDHPGYDEEFSRKITKEEHFWSLCSTLQAWVENGYDTRLLHSNLAFPLAKALADAGDQQARSMYEREVLARWKSGFDPVQRYFVDCCRWQLSERLLLAIAVIGGPRDLIEQLDCVLQGSINSDMEKLAQLWSAVKTKEQLHLITLFSESIMSASKHYQGSEGNYQRIGASNIDSS
jgi:hypothetical protein